MNLYRIFDKYQKWLKSELIEISIKQSQITFIFKDGEILYHNDIEELDLIRSSALFDDEEDIWISVAETNPVIIVPFSNRESEQEVESTFYQMYKYILQISKDVCTCPSLEIVFSNQYIKFFLDKPNLTIKDLTAVKNILKQKNEVFEFHAQRPYMLFINEEGVTNG